MCNLDKAAKDNIFCIIQVKRKVCSVLESNVAIFYLAKV